MKQKYPKASIFLLALFVVPALAQAQTTKQADLLQPGTSWAGLQFYDERLVDRGGQRERERPAEVKVLEREGEKFVAEYWVTLFVRHGVRLEGRIRNGQIIAQPTRILAGPNWEPGVLDRQWQGKLEDKNLILERRDNRDLAITGKLTYEDHPEPSPGGRGGRGGRRGRRGE